eukprot:Gregarina_sp_Poly_1__6296@NODE_3345_length_1163_cov_614_146898_g2118_i0_p1_GENE_NODE_3345_length_1163_cov_614_146898_g2118_i0NODE_3345_length_1163_cov_614_146898_g2118_i0_p1_ORF_typecomplete_len354_score29_73Ribosomal_L4/PF00573_22/2_5e40Ribos_L4_asso_C/PF14374_6/4_1e03Ribos_L4_asso_C/PF14374_6/3_8e03Ribos_L4_asso_C/PF14374_6/3_4e23_NODE_3345_length_1163_cov_614_146898_g2118_i01021100
MSARPLVTVYDTLGKAKTSVGMPAVCLAPVRPDHIRYVHTQMAKNARQAYAVSRYSGYQSSAESWGTGRAVARIPRVAGGGTHRAGQGAFGNMCRGGGMYSPTKTWRRWHRRINETERRHALASAIAASSVPALVMARGHRIDAVPEIPLVLQDDLEKVEKTKQAMKLLEGLGCAEDLERVKDSKTVRAGQGKRRNNRFTMRRGPLIVHNGDKDSAKGFRNIPGVEICHVDRLNLLQIAPGGSLGRFIIYSESAFRKLNTIWTNNYKKGYILPKAVMTQTDLARIINSNEVQSVLRAQRSGRPHRTQHKNPLTNYAVKVRLNPAAKIKKQDQ